MVSKVHIFRFDLAFESLNYVFEHEKEIESDTFIPPFAYPNVSLVEMSFL
jgi:hypothetical protein